MGVVWQIQVLGREVLKVRLERREVEELSHEKGNFLVVVGM